MNKEILQKAIDTYGVESQIDVCIEEMSELTKALIKDKRNDSISVAEWKSLVWKNIVEEIADVEIMLTQMKMIFNCKEDVESQIEFKINRLKERLEG